MKTPNIQHSLSKFVSNWHVQMKNDVSLWSTRAKQFLPFLEEEKKKCLYFPNWTTPNQLKQIIPLPRAFCFVFLKWILTNSYFPALSFLRMEKMFFSPNENIPLMGRIVTMNSHTQIRYHRWQRRPTGEVQFYGWNIVKFWNNWSWLSRFWNQGVVRNGAQFHSLREEMSERQLGEVEVWSTIWWVSGRYRKLD